jgi:MFS family permease
VSGYLTDRLGAKPVVFFGVVALTLTTALLTTVGAGTTGEQWALLLFARGVGIGFTMMPAFSAAYVSLSHAAIGRATAISNTIQRIFSSLGIAILATMIQARVMQHQPVFHQRPTPAQAHAAAVGAFGAAFDDTMWVAAAIIILALPATLLLRRAKAAATQRPVPRPLVAATIAVSVLLAAVLLAQGFGVSPPPL